MTDYEEIKKMFFNKVDYIYQEEKIFYLNISSTTVDLTNNEVKILREGTISEKEILDVLKGKQREWKRWLLLLQITLDLN